MIHDKIKMTVVVGVLNGFDLAKRMIDFLVENMDRPDDVQLIVIDNGSDENFLDYINSEVGVANLAKKLGEFTVIKNDLNLGNYPLFWQGLENARGDIVAFLHSDVFVYQKGWDAAVIAQFGRSEVGLVGFIGSTELDAWGGRGGGTRSNMQGREVDRWKGSAAEIHGKRDTGFVIDGAVVDGCVMIFRKSVLETLERKNYPPHHFYDRLFSIQVLEKGYKVGILGVEFDHFSGQTANHQQKWQDTSKEWFRLNLGIETPQAWADARREWVDRGNSPSRGKVPDQWDYAAYLEAEYLFLTEYRDNKKLVPRVN